MNYGAYAFTLIRAGWRAGRCTPGGLGPACTALGDICRDGAAASRMTPPGEPWPGRSLRTGACRTGASPNISLSIIFKYRLLLNPGLRPEPQALEGPSGRLHRARCYGCLATLLDSVAQSVGCFRQERGGAARPLTRFFFLIKWNNPPCFHIALNYFYPAL